jgi:hypothetical protein
VGPSATLVIDAASAPSLADLRAALAAPDPAAAVMGLLSLADLGSMPAFAYVGREPIGVRVLVRGDVFLHLSGTVESSATGSGLSTWHESIHVGATEARITDERGDAVAVLVLDALQPAIQTSTVIGPDDAAGAQPPDALVAEPVTTEAADPERKRIEDPEAELAPVEASEDDCATAGQPPISEDTIFPGLDEVPVAAIHGPSDDIPRFDDPEPPADPPWAPPPREATPAPLGDEVDLSHLFETRHVGAEAAAVRDHLEGGVISGVPGSPSVPVATPGGDHDGHTVGPDAMAQLRGSDAAVAVPSAPSAPIDGPTVQAVRCALGHLNPPHAEACRSCRTPISDRSVEIVARPALGHLDFASGLVVDVDRPLLMGRKPTAGGHSGEAPALVVLPDPEGSLSRAHLEVRVEGWEVLVVDLGSLNGTMVELPGQEPVQLHALDPFLITDGTEITLAGTTSCVFRTGAR